MGPLISAGQREAVASFVPDGAPVAIRGAAPDGPGFWFPPTVLCPVDPDDRAVREEIFGPVAVVIPFRDEAEAIALANDTIYGLSGSIWTRDGAQGAARRARGRDRRALDQLEHVGAGVDAVRRLQAVGLRPRARPARARRTTPSSSRSTTRREADGAPRREGLRHHRRGERDRRRDRAALQARRARRWSASTCATTRRASTSRWPCDVADEDAGARHVRAACAREYGRDRRAVQQRRHLPAPTTPRCSRRRSRPGSACRTSTSSRSSSAASTASRTCSRPAAAR